MIVLFRKYEENPKDFSIDLNKSRQKNDSHINIYKHTFDCLPDYKRKLVFLIEKNSGLKSLVPGF